MEARSPGAYSIPDRSIRLITIAPTRTGKTAGPVICNALTHPGQLIVLDVKGEVHRVTARRRRQMGQKVHVLDLRDGKDKSDCLNPLDLAARCGTEAAAIARSFAAQFIERGRDERDRFWNDWAETMITAGVAWLLDDCEPNRRMAQDFAALVGGVDPDAVTAMPRDGQLLMIEGEPPCVSRRMRYFEEPMFAGLYDPNLMFGRSAVGTLAR